MLVITATVSGCEGWKQIKDFGEAKLDWLRKFLLYYEGILVDDTLANVSIKASVRRKRLLAALKDDYRETLIRQVI